MHPKFDLNGVRTHDLQINTAHFVVTETPALPTQPSVIVCADMPDVADMSHYCWTKLSDKRDLNHSTAHWYLVLLLSCLYPETTCMHKWKTNRKFTSNTISALIALALCLSITVNVQKRLADVKCRKQNYTEFVPYSCVSCLFCLYISNTNRGVSGQLPHIYAWVHNSASNLHTLCLPLW